MKILFLHPQINAKHASVDLLKKEGAVCLFANGLDEARQILESHGKNIDLAVVHREGAQSKDADLGIRFIDLVKKDPDQTDLPIILSSGIWTEANFAKHQASANGVNAYFSVPFRAEKLVSLIHEVLGDSWTKNSPEPKTPEEGLAGPVLEDPSDLYAGSPASPELEAHAPITISELSIPMAQSTEPSHLEVTLPTASESLISLQDDGTSILDVQAQALPVADASQASLVVEEPDAAAEKEAQNVAPYLYEAFSQKPSQPEKPARVPIDPERLLGQPLGDAIVPGGATNPPDMETLKDYLLLREQDVAVLSAKLRDTQEQVESLQSDLTRERAEKEYLAKHVADLQSKIEGLEAQLALGTDGLNSELEDLKFKVREKTDTARSLEKQVKKATEEVERMKDRVRQDIRKIRQRERELENKLEILQKDTEAVIQAREGRILDLKRKLDLLEFNMDLLQSQYAKEKEVNGVLKKRLGKAAQAVRVVGGLLDSQAKDAEQPESGSDDQPLVDLSPGDSTRFRAS